MDIQMLIDGLTAKWQQERAKTQMTLGKLISALAEMPDGAEVANLYGAHSYRGYYEDIAFERGEGNRPAADLLAECRAAMGEVFYGWKGGEFVMGALTPVWLAHRGDVGLKLMALRAGGEVETADEDEMK